MSESKHALKTVEEDDGKAGLEYSGDVEASLEFEEYDLYDGMGMHSISQSYQAGQALPEERFRLYSVHSQASQPGDPQQDVTFSQDCESSAYGFSSYSTSYKPDTSVPSCPAKVPNEKSRLVRDRDRPSISGPYPRSRTVTAGSFSQGQSAFTSSLYKLQNTFSTTAHAIGRTNSLFVSQRGMAYTWSLAHVPSSDRQASTLLTFFNTLGLIQGISMLVTPFITARGGLSAVILMLLLGILSWYTSVLILDCQYQISMAKPGQRKRVFSSYIEIGAYAFPKFGGTILKIFTISGMVTDIYCFILLGQMTVDLFPKGSPLQTQQWILIWAVFVFPSFFITKVSILSWLAFVALVAYTIALIICYIYLFSWLPSWNIANLPVTPSLEYVTISYGVILNTYNFLQSVPALEGSMKQPASCRRMLTAAFGVNIAMKVVFGLAGALTFGLAVDQSITSSLGLSVPVSLTVNILTSINLFFNFPMSLFVVFEMMDTYITPYFPIFKKGQRSFWGWMILSRSLVMVLVLFVAVTVGQFGLVVSFVGSVRGTLVSVVFPISFYLSLRWRHLSRLSIVGHVTLVIVCSLMGICGAYFSMNGIITGV